MFEPFFNSEVKREEDAHNKQINFTREQNTMANATQTEPIDIVSINEKSDLIRWQQDLDDELKEVVLQLKGYKKQVDGTWVLPNNAMPLCNDKFIDDVVIPQCSPFISRSLINSNFSEERILMNLCQTMNDIADNMADGYYDYEIEFINFPLITRLLKNVITPTSFRSLNGWTKKTDSTIFKRIESAVENQNDKKQNNGFFGLK